MLCGICQRRCSHSCICCDSCQIWIHYSCLNFDQSVILDLQTELTDEQYFCSSCTRKDGIFKYDESLKRLEKGSVLVKLKRIAKMENLMMPQREFQPVKSDDLISRVNQDDYVNRILEKHKTRDYKALCSTNDGNCLFNSASLVLSGSEEIATELRVRTCLMMVLNREKILCDENLNLSEICDSYDTSCLKCAQDSTWANAYAIAGLSMAIKIRILSIFPPQNGILDKTYIYLSRYFNPENRLVNEIVLFWSGYYNAKGFWVANHIVPLVPFVCDTNINFESPVTISMSSRDTETFIKLEIDENRSVRSSYHESNKEDLIINRQNSLETNEGRAVKKCKIVDVRSLKNATIIDHLQDDFFAHFDTQQLLSITTLSDVSRFEKFFTSAREIYEYISMSRNIFNEYPSGIKSNCQFILKDNQSRHLFGLTRNFYDDCGEWDYVKKRYHTDFYLRDYFKIIYKRENEFCFRKMILGDRAFIRIDPQPKMEEVIHIVRYEVTHKFSTEFIRRISIVIDPQNSEISDLMLYQYKGDQPPNTNLK